MATKDWKKISGKSLGGTVWEKNDKYHIGVGKLSGVQRVLQERDYVFLIVKNQVHTRKYFKTKRQALAYAKAYMRKH
jgi:hypothetical protein